MDHTRGYSELGAIRLADWDESKHPRDAKGQFASDAEYDAKLQALRKDRDSLLLKSRNEKNTARWRKKFKQVTDDLNATADEYRKARWSRRKQS
jgi:hypothetical protein